MQVGRPEETNKCGLKPTFITKKTGCAEAVDCIFFFTNWLKQAENLAQAARGLNNSAWLPSAWQEVFLFWGGALGFVKARHF